MQTRWVGLMVAAAAVVALAGCGDDGDAEADSGTSPDADGGGQGTVAVRLEPVDGFLIEGFEMGLRFSTADGTEVERVVWNDYVASLGDDSIEAYYESVLEQPVPAGAVVVGAVVNVGIGPPPEPPDLDAPELPCRLEVEVPAGGRVDVEVSFAGEDCLTEV